MPSVPTQALARTPCTKFSKIERVDNVSIVRTKNFTREIRLGSFDQSLLLTVFRHCSYHVSNHKGICFRIKLKFMRSKIIVG